MRWVPVVKVRMVGTVTEMNFLCAHIALRRMSLESLKASDVFVNTDASRRYMEPLYDSVSRSRLKSRT